MHINCQGIYSVINAVYSEHAIYLPGNRMYKQFGNGRIDVKHEFFEGLLLILTHLKNVAAIEQFILEIPGINIIIIINDVQFKLLTNTKKMS